ncbi:MAG: hypothetical protein AABX39_01555 [Nanoarchaeota archaeon]
MAVGNVNAVLAVMRGFEILSGYESSDFKGTPFEGLELKVEHVGGKQLYCSISVDERYKITVGNTEIDVSLKTANVATQE